MDLAVGIGRAVVEDPPRACRADFADLGVKVLLRQRSWSFGSRMVRFAFMSKAVTGRFKVSL